MDTDQNSTQALSPQAIVSLFESLTDSLSGPLDVRRAQELSSAGGYDWAAGLAVREALNSGVHPWLVIRVLSDVIRTQAEDDETTAGIPLALDMLDKADLLCAGRLDADNDHVRWRILGMIAESKGSVYQEESGVLLDAALSLAVSDDPLRSPAGALLEKAARSLVAEEFVLTGIHAGEYRGAQPKVQAAAAAQKLLNILVANLDALPRNPGAANENGVAHAS